VTSESQLINFDTVIENKDQEESLTTQLPLPTDFSLEAYKRCALSRTATSIW